MWSFAKGHGTQNDFVLVKDRHGMLCPSQADVRYLCDRHAGIGADGVLRVVKAGSMPEWDGDPDLWFMDYRNGDGSVAEMCGNGLRVFVRYLLEENLVGGADIQVATRAGLRRAAVLPDGRIKVAMGQVASTGTSTVDYQGQLATGVGVDVGNPHLVVELDPQQVAQAELRSWPRPDPVRFPEGANVELAARTGNGFTMRVLERGVGETRSCGTGAVAVAWVLSAGAAGTHRIELPGGVVEVTLDDQGRAWLTGPAVIVARGEVALPEPER